MMFVDARARAPAVPDQVMIGYQSCLAFTETVIQ